LIEAFGFPALVSVADARDDLVCFDFTASQYGEEYAIGLI